MAMGRLHSVSAPCKLWKTCLRQFSVSSSNIVLTTRTNNCHYTNTAKCLYAQRDINKPSHRNQLAQHIRPIHYTQARHNTHPPRCWNCDHEPSVYVSVCPSCQVLQPVDYRRNYFEVLGVENKFHIDTKELSRLFRKLQVVFHPDKYSLKSQTELHHAVDHSSLVNKAYQCLMAPVDRALYLLELAGQPLTEGQIDLDPEFLMEIMEVNEELAEAEDREAVREIGEKNQNILEGLLKEADEAFSDHDIGRAREVVARIKYYNNIYEKVREYERHHGIID